MKKMTTVCNFRVFLLCASVFLLLSRNNDNASASPSSPSSSSSAPHFNSANNDYYQRHYYDDDGDGDNDQQPYRASDAYRDETGQDEDENEAEAGVDAPRDYFNALHADSNEEEEDAARNFVSEHETPRPVAVKVRIRGDLATPAPEAGINLGFVPKQTYYQVRRYDTEVHLPRSAAIEEAETAEELLNAPRLREVVSHKKTQEVYEEQGYEDAGYDHAGYKKAGQRHESSHKPIVVAAAADSSGTLEDRRARIDDQSSEQARIVNTARSDNATMAARDGGDDDVDGDDNDNNSGVPSSRTRKIKQKDAQDASAEDASAGEGTGERRGQSRDSGEQRDRDDGVNNAVVRKKVKVRAGGGIRSRTKAKSDSKSEKDAEQNARAPPYRSKVQREQLSSSSSSSSLSSSSSSSPSPVSFQKRRKVKSNSTTTTGDGNAKKSGDTKLGQESKTVQSKLKLTRDERQNDTVEREAVSPTTYRPSTLPETVSRLRTAAAKRKRPPLSRANTQKHDDRAAAAAAPSSAGLGAVAPTSSFSKNMLIDDGSGYVFENPFSHYENSHEIKSFASPFQWKSSSGGVGANAVNERYKPRSYDALNGVKRPLVVAKSKFLRSKAKTFPYDIVGVDDATTAAATPSTVGDSTSSASRPWQDASIAATPVSSTVAKWRKKTPVDPSYAAKSNFPYEIITSRVAPATRTKSPAYPYDSVTKSSEKLFWSPHKRLKHLRMINATSPFGTADDSPWIPITPKEAYDIHGYAARRKNLVSGGGGGGHDIKVTESAENSPERLDARPTNKRKTNPIRMLENVDVPWPSSSSSSSSSKEPRSSARTVSTSYSIRHEYDSPKVSTPISAIFKNDAWMEQPNHRFEGWRTTTTWPSSLPQINESFDEQRKHFDDAFGAFTRPPSQSESSSSSSSSSTSSIESAASSWPTSSASNRDWSGGGGDGDSSGDDDSKDIETLSSNRYAVFQPLEHATRPMQKSAAFAGDDGYSVSHSTRQSVADKPLQYRHPYLPRETSHLQQAVITPPSPPPRNLTSLKSGVALFIGFNVPDNSTTAAPTMSTTTTTTTTVEPSVVTGAGVVKRLEKIIVYPADYASSASFVENLTLAHYANPVNAIRASLPLNFRDRFNTLTDHLTKNKTSGSGGGGGGGGGVGGGSRKVKRAVSDQQLLNIYMDGSTTEMTVDVRKYPFYKMVSAADGANPLSKYSVLRYISNPKLVPTKTAGQMSFYQSTNDIRCPEPEPPRDVIPKRQRDGEWVGDGDGNGNDARRGKPRVRDVGRSILCHKIKFFGSDPLDNPFFQEQSIGFPQIFPSAAAAAKTRTMTKRAAKIGTTAQNDSVGKKMVRKVYLAGGFINISSNDSTSTEEEKKKKKQVQKEEQEEEEQQQQDANSAILHENSTWSVNFPRVVKAAYGLRSTTTTTTTTATTIPAVTIADDDQISATSTVNKYSRNDTSNGASPPPPPFKPQYKEPSWRNKKHGQGAAAVGAGIASKHKLSGTVDDALPDSQVDSLLYVIHPHSGRGKWMKILKVEQLSTTAPREGNSSASGFGVGVSDSRVAKFRSKSSPVDIANANVNANANATKTVADDAQFASNNQLTQHRDSCGFGFGQHPRQITRQTQPDGKPAANDPSVSETYATVPDIYHISGLLKQVAPLKASQAEINNLQTTEEHLAEDADDDNKTNEDGGGGGGSSSRSGASSAIQFPQPHERLYYYVVDE